MNKREETRHGGVGGDDDTAEFSTFTPTTQPKECQFRVAREMIFNSHCSRNEKLKLQHVSPHPHSGTHFCSLLSLATLRLELLLRDFHSMIVQQHSHREIFLVLKNSGCTNFIVILHSGQLDLTAASLAV